jgi:hypothetical protein
MITYQDMEKEMEHGTKIVDFIKSAIEKHKGTPEYVMASVADAYNRHRNLTIMQYQKFLYLASGKAVVDNYSANYKLRTNMFNRLVRQQNQYLLGNGVKWEKEETANKLGDDFDNKLQDAGEKAIVHGEAFGFWNLNHVEIFSLLEYVPIVDEETGAMKAGIRFWQIDESHPLRATFYELDGYTEYIWRKESQNGGEELAAKRSYQLKTKGTEADGMEIVGGENYVTFPIVPLWANKYKQSEFEGMRENIDAYDLIKSGFCNNVDDASEVYWIIQNAGGMDDIDIAEFLQKLKTKHAANVDDDQKAEPNTIDIPTEAREKLLDRLRADIYEDFMALDTKNIANGAVTATQIEAAYEPVNEKADGYEYCILEFIKEICRLAGVEDNPTFTRSVIVNATEIIQDILQAAPYLSAEYVTEKILTVLGDGDKAEAVLKAIDEESMNRFGGNND